MNRKNVKTPCEPSICKQKFKIIGFIRGNPNSTISAKKLQGNSTIANTSAGNITPFNLNSIINKSTHQSIINSRPLERNNLRQTLFGSYNNWPKQRTRIPFLDKSERNTYSANNSQTYIGYNHKLEQKRLLELSNKKHSFCAKLREKSNQGRLLGNNTRNKNEILQRNRKSLGSALTIFQYSERSEQVAKYTAQIKPKISSFFDRLKKKKRRDSVSKTLSYPKIYIRRIASQKIIIEKKQKKALRFHVQLPLNIGVKHHNNRNEEGMNSKSDITQRLISLLIGGNERKKSIITNSFD